MKLVIRKASQLEMFAGLFPSDLRKPVAKPVDKPAAKPAAKPIAPAGGWAPIPGGSIAGGLRRRRGDRYEYMYPDKADAPAVRAPKAAEVKLIVPVAPALSSHVHVSGNTFAAKRYLKEAGGKWDPDEQHWVVPRAAWTKLHADSATDEGSYQHRVVHALSVAGEPAKGGAAAPPVKAPEPTPAPAPAPAPVAGGMPTQTVVVGAVTLKLTGSVDREFAATHVTIEAFKNGVLTATFSDLAVEAKIAPENRAVVQAAVRAVEAATRATPEYAARKAKDQAVAALDEEYARGHAAVLHAGEHGFAPPAPAPAPTEALQARATAAAISEANTSIGYAMDDARGGQHARAASNIDRRIAEHVDELQTATGVRVPALKAAIAAFEVAKATILAMVVPVSPPKATRGAADTITMRVKASSNGNAIAFDVLKRLGYQVKTRHTGGSDVLVKLPYGYLPAAYALLDASSKVKGYTDDSEDTPADEIPAANEEPKPEAPAPVPPVAEPPAPTPEAPHTGTRIVAKVVRDGVTYTATTERHSDEVDYAANGVTVPRSSLPGATTRRQADGSRSPGYMNTVSELLDGTLDQESSRLANVKISERTGTFNVDSDDPHSGPKEAAPVPPVVPPVAEPAPPVAAPPQLVVPVDKAPTAKPLALTDADVEAYETTGYVWGSRAELWQLMSGGTLETDPAIAHKLVTKDRVMGAKFDSDTFLAAERAAGTQPAAAWMKSQLLGAIQTRPGDSAEERELYLQTVGDLQTDLARCKTGADVAELMGAWKHLATAEVLGTATRADLEADPSLKADIRTLLMGRPSGRGLTEEAYDIAMRPYIAAGTRVANKYGYRDDEAHKRGMNMPSVRVDYKFDMVVTKYVSTNIKQVSKFHVLGPKFSNIFGFSTKLSPYVRSFSGFNRGGTGDAATLSDVRMKDTSSKAASEFARGVKDVQAATDTEAAWAVAHPKEKASKEGVTTESAGPPGSERTDWHTVLRQAQLGQVERKGPAIPGLSGASAIDVKTSLGLREVEYGNWADAGERQWHTEAALGAMHDLGAILGIPSTKLGLNGRLSLSFGSRGKGGKSAGVAHYEPDTKVINLTKLSGAGSLAHEWGHALDHMTHYAYHPGVGQATFVSDVTDARKVNTLAKSTPAAISKAMADAIDEISYDKSTPESEIIPKFTARHAAARAAYNVVLRQANQAQSYVNATPTGAMRDAFRDKRAAFDPELKRLAAIAKPLEQAAKLFDKTRNINLLRDRTPMFESASHMGPYWTRPHELFARSFEAYVSRKLAKSDRLNTYLTPSPTMINTIAATAAGFYPVGAHGERVDAAMETLMNAIKEHDVLAKAFWGEWLHTMRKAHNIPTLVVQ